MDKKGRTLWEYDHLLASIIKFGVYITGNNIMWVRIEHELPTVLFWTLMASPCKLNHSQICYCSLITTLVSLCLSVR